MRETDFTMNALIWNQIKIDPDEVNQLDDIEAELFALDNATKSKMCVNTQRSSSSRPKECAVGPNLNACKTLKT